MLPRAPPVTVSPWGRTRGSLTGERPVQVVGSGLGWQLAGCRGAAGWPAPLPNTPLRVSGQSPHTNESS
jgi:hypothetical protein